MTVMNVWLNQCCLFEGQREAMLEGAYQVNLLVCVNLIVYFMFVFFTVERFAEILQKCLSRGLTN